jgi:hypothetical protein
MENKSSYYSNALSKYISKQGDSYFTLDILHNDVLLEPYFHNKTNLFMSNIKGEICNFLYIEPGEITVDNIQSLVGQTVLYQYPSKYSVSYHLRFVRIIAVNKSTQTITLVNPASSTPRSTLEKMVSLRHNDTAYRIWMPVKLYTEKMVEMGDMVVLDELERNSQKNLQN